MIPGFVSAHLGSSPKQNGKFVDLHKESKDSVDQKKSWHF